MPTLKTNIKELKYYTTYAPADNKQRIRDIINLYENRTINNYKTALNTVKLLASKNYKVAD